MSEYLHLSTIVLAGWLTKRLPKLTDNWWDECVLNSLSDSQRSRAISSGLSKLEELDLSALLRVTNKNWIEMRSMFYLPQSERECVNEMFAVRNNWAHCAGTIPGKDIIVRDIDTLFLFLRQMMVANDVLDDIETFKISVREMRGVQPENAVAEKPSMGVDVTASKEEISEKSMVYLVSNPTVKGMVFSITKLESTNKYDVFINGEIKTFYDGQIALIETEAEYISLDITDLQSCLTAYQINNPAIGSLYSLNAARIDFVPYQFRPALKIIKSDVPRILIADSVGVGKTIEAGLILKELEARFELEKILIICPKPLVVERKWELEMKRFDEDFVSINGGTLRQIISDIHRDGEWPERYGKVIVPYSILGKEVLFGQGGTKKRQNLGLLDLDPAPHFDLVIVDEAHHIRNSDTQGYAVVKYFCDHADAVVFLTATPLQTSDDDLYTLLNVLRPDVVLDKETFNMMSNPNKYISKASHHIRTTNENWQEAAIRELAEIKTTQWGQNIICPNPVYNEVINLIKTDNISREDRVKLISDVESLHSFSGMLNRTRRQDIQDFCIRRSHTVESCFTHEQQALHDELLDFEAAALGVLHSNSSIRFMMTTISRQAASCIFGLAPFIRGMIKRRFNQILDDPEFDIDSLDIDDKSTAVLNDMAKNVLDLADNLPAEDPKFDSIERIIEEKQKQEKNKIIVFSTFKHTLAYIKEKLIDRGYRVAQIDGSVKDEERLALRSRFERPKGDSAALDILLFTEVGCEGLDYQFCDMMINYDLPWNPMRIEQRIGRIDRRGQKSEVVNIYNMITEGTIDAVIYHRCLMRIGVFEESIGECSEILGDMTRELNFIAIDPNLTADERQLKLERIADNEVRKVQEMRKLESEEKQLFGFDLSNYAMSKEIQEAENPWLNSKWLLHLIKQYLNQRIGNGNYVTGDSDLKLLRLSAEARKLLLEDFRKLSSVKSSVKRKWELYLKSNTPNCQITLDSDAAENNRNAFFITPVHPFAKQAASHFTFNKSVYISIKYNSSDHPEGQYPFSIYAWDYKGFKAQGKLVAVCSNDGIQKEIMDIIQDAQQIELKPSLFKDMWDKLESCHLSMWTAEKQNHKAAAEASARYKLESLTNNFTNRKRIIEQQIADAYEDNIIRMKQGELENATVLYKEKVTTIEQETIKADIHIELIANGILLIGGY